MLPYAECVDALLQQINVPFSALHTNLDSHEIDQYYQNTGWPKEVSRYQIIKKFC